MKLRLGIKPRTCRVSLFGMLSALLCFSGGWSQDSRAYTRRDVRAVQCLHWWGILLELEVSARRHGSASQEEKKRKVMDQDSFNVVITTPEVFLYEKSLYALVLKKKSKGRACLSTIDSFFLPGINSFLSINCLTVVWDNRYERRDKCATCNIPG